MPNPLPSHIAIIMDGNGRWAEQRNLPRSIGHKKGVNRAKEIVEFSAENSSIEYLTLYAFSIENWNRPFKEVSFLMTLINDAIDNELDSLVENGIKLSFLGVEKNLDKKILRKMKKAEKMTKNGSNLVLNVAFNYSGRLEILSAVKEIIKDGLKPEDLNEMTFSKYLYTREIPDPDLLIRTSGEFRISNYLLWQIAYSEIYITDTLWPDFTVDNFKEALNDYKKRDRRFGGIE